MRSRDPKSVWLALAFCLVARSAVAGGWWGAWEEGADTRAVQSNRYNPWSATAPSVPPRPRAEDAHGQRTWSQLAAPVSEWGDRPQKWRPDRNRNRGKAQGLYRRDVTDRSHYNAYGPPMGYSGLWVWGMPSERLNPLYGGFGMPSYYPGDLNGIVP